MPQHPDQPVSGDEDPGPEDESSEYDRALWLHLANDLRRRAGTPELTALPEDEKHD